MMNTCKTNSMPLAAVVFALLPGAVLKDCIDDESKPGRQIFVIDFPTELQSKCDEVFEEFKTKKLCINLYLYHSHKTTLRKQMREMQRWRG